MAECTVGDEGVIADFSYMSIFSQVFGLPAPVLLPSSHFTIRFGFVVKF